MDGRKAPRLHFVRDFLLNDEWQYRRGAPTAGSSASSLPRSDRVAHPRHAARSGKGRKRDHDELADTELGGRAD